MLGCVPVAILYRNGVLRIMNSLKLVSMEPRGRLLFVGSCFVWQQRLCKNLSEIIHEGTVKTWRSTLSCYFVILIAAFDTNTPVVLLYTVASLILFLHIYMHTKCVLSISLLPCQDIVRSRRSNI